MSGVSLLSELLGSIARRSWLGDRVPNRPVAVDRNRFAAPRWVFCFGMSRYSQALERKLHTGHENT